jgi:hypothetical protein
MARKTEGNGVPKNLKALVEEDRDLLREIVGVALQEMLEAEMDEAVGAGGSGRLRGPETPAADKTIVFVNCRHRAVLRTTVTLARALLQ